MRFYRLFQVANQKARKAIDNVHVILNKIHLSLYATKIMASFPLIYSWHLTILGSCYCKNHIDVSFLCVCPLIDDEFHHNIVKVAVEPRATGERFRSKRQFVF